MFVESDFIPVPCCHPTCRSATYSYVENGSVTPLPRVVDVDKYLDYIANRTLPDIRPEILDALEGLWSASSVPGTTSAAKRFDCAACNLSFSSETAYLKKHVFMIVGAGLCRPLHPGPQSAHEVLRRGAHTRRPDNPVLRLQQRGLPGEGPFGPDSGRDAVGNEPPRARNTLRF